MILAALLLACSPEPSAAASPAPSLSAAAPAAPAPPAAPAAPPAASLVELAPGFELGTWPIPTPTPLGPGELVYVRVDPARVTLRVRAASFEGGRNRVASAWATPGAKAVAVINTSMFADDWQTSVGHFVVGGRVQRASWAQEQNSLLVAEPVAAGRPRAALVNLGCTDREATTAAWRTRVQSIRMLGCDGQNVWAQEPRRWSSALVGADRAGRLLFLHTRAPYTMHDLVEELRASPLDLVALHYGEGGPEASLYVRGPGVERTEVGAYETGFAADNALEWELPNVLEAVVE